MKALLLRLEPLIWVLFGGGIMVGTMLLTGWVLVFGVLAPMGIVPAEALSYGRAHGLASHLIGRVVLAALIILPLWKGAHHVRSLFVDFGGGERDATVATLLYAIATAGSVFAIVAVARL